MLVYVEFLDWEKKLLVKAASELGVAERCHYVDDVDAFADDGTLAISTPGLPNLPAVIFLSMVCEAETWRQSLHRLKSHPVLAGVPVVGLGNLKIDEIDDVYEIGGNSYIEKPDTFEEMMAAAKTCLDYWLRFVLLPQKHLQDR